MAKKILEVKNLVKEYRNFTAVNDISFSMDEGEVLGLLGPNGAGKSTTIQILLGITSPTAGSISYFGKNFYQNRGYCLQRLNFTTAYGSLQGRTTVYENLKVFAGLYQVKNADEKIEQLMDLLEIKHLKDRLFWFMSAGEKTRVSLAKSLINDPQLILMDEPTASLDPDIADKVLSWIEKLRKEKNLSILYTSHNMDEVARICDRVIFLSHGEIVAQDTPLGLTKRVKKAKLKITFDDVEKNVEKYLTQKKVSFSFPRHEVVVIEVSEDRIPEILFGFKSSNIWITDIDIQKPDLEDVFLEVARKRRKKNVS